MLWFRSKNKQRIIEDKVKDLNQGLDTFITSDSLKTNIELFRSLFKDDDTFIMRNIQNSNNSSLKFCLAFCDGVTSTTVSNENIIKPLMLVDIPKSNKDLIDVIKEQVVLVNETEKSNNIKELIKAITYGDTVLFVDGSKDALILNTKGFKTRELSEPEGEKILSGPREGFTESLILNLSMVRRRIRTNDLKFKYYSVGRRTNTQICLCYIDSIVNKNILNELNKRLDKIDIDAVLDANYINELIKDNSLSPFRTTGYTERPDVVVGKILEGRIAIFVDGSPVVLTVPYLFIENFQSSEDYYLNYYYTSFSRIIRMIGFFLTCTVPALYIAVGAFHHEMFPTPLLINIASERQSVPLPAALEALLMLIVFDILKETGIRMPTNVGQALSIVGALVIGQAAVEAKLIAAPMIIVVALTGITNLLIPKMNAPVIYIRFFILGLSTILGFFGFVLGCSLVFIHILSLNSCGISMTLLTGNLKYQEVKDIAIRAPLWQMRKRPEQISNDTDRINMPDGDSNG